jgi:hypothetical protein
LAGGRPAKGRMKLGVAGHAAVLARRCTELARRRRYPRALYIRPPGRAEFCPKVAAARLAAAKAVHFSLGSTRGNRGAVGGAGRRAAGVGCPSAGRAVRRCRVRGDPGMPRVIADPDPGRGSAWPAPEHRSTASPRCVRWRRCWPRSRSPSNRSKGSGCVLRQTSA